jgi:hypothetical protein
MRLLYLAVLLAGLALLPGCASNESDNASVRPWNSPRGWEGGLPSQLNEGH